MGDRLTSGIHAAGVRVLILPGRGDSGPAHWQSAWERTDPALVRVRQAEWDDPHVDDWVATLDAAIQSDDTPAILVAHSLAVALVAHWAARHRGPVAGALLVAASDVERDDYRPGARGFAPIPLQRLPFESILVASDDDPRVTVERAAAFARAWGARLARPGAFGHLGSAEALGDWPYGQALLRQLVEHAVAARSAA
ncbi:alpha/beta hydrolase [Luteimonas sp. Y-2-2-4F]|nr:alpha/beta fold hydrolase [Luteimonas sp. Y-2-2-4F]MCD9033298.1 alpha/beta hydrolase [Luteimonas sp. Y-2-2-4F]